MRWLDSITNSMDRNLSKLWKTVEDGGAWQASVYKAAKSLTQLSDWKVKWKLLSGVQVFATLRACTVHRILQARILEGVAFPFFRGIFPTQGFSDWTTTQSSY